MHLISTILTESAKTRNNCSIINVQHKALKTLGAYLCIIEKIPEFFERFFLSEKGPNNKNLDITLFACSREVGRSLFRCSRAKNT